VPTKRRTSSSDICPYVGYLTTSPASRLDVIDNRLTNECGTVGGTAGIKPEVTFKLRSKCLLNLTFQIRGSGGAEYQKFTEISEECTSNIYRVEA
jgi:hypothetical protein